MRRRLVTLVMLALSAAGVGCGRGGDGPSAGGSASGGVELREYPLGGDFTLTSHEGTPFRLTDVRGKIVFLFFGYVTCPDVCPLTMSKLADAVKRVPVARNDVVVLFVTVDVDRDTPAALARYVRSFDLPMIGLTGTRAEVDAVVAQYKSAYEITPSASAGGPEVSHTSYTYAIDRAGKVRALISHDDSAEDAAGVLRLLLEE
ncbi:MAG: SCO family protein [Acidobacteria bacterium]|nr:SCO family protein [Acidobacteriota bacterium]